MNQKWPVATDCCYFWLPTGLVITYLIAVCIAFFFRVPWRVAVRTWGALYCFTPGRREPSLITVITIKRLV